MKVKKAPSEWRGSCAGAYGTVVVGRWGGKEVAVKRCVSRPRPISREV